MSGRERVLARLNDGQWHSSYELTHELSVMSHSRIAELRARGYTIESRRVAGEEGLRAFQYRLTGTPGAPTRETPPSLPADGDNGASEPHPGQLVLEVAA